MEISKKECEYCHESIDTKSRRCPFCGSLLNLSKNSEKQDYINSQDYPKQDNDDNQDLSDDQDFSTNLNNQNDHKIREEAISHKPQTDFIINSPNNNNSMGNWYNYADSKGRNTRNNYEGSNLSNAMKVFITVISSIVPGLGQIVGIIIAIIFMNSEDDVDKRSFGVALLVSSLILFIIACLSCFILTLFAGEVFQNIPNNYGF